MDFILSLVSWGKSTQMCSPVSQTLLFSLIFMAISIAVAGVYVWMRFIRKQPVSVVQVESAAQSSDSAGGVAQALVA